MNTPKIRFKGFKDDWEQRKLGEIVLRESLARESTIDLPYVEYEDVIAEEGRINKDIRKKEGIKKGIFFDGSQVLYGKLRPYLHNWLNPDFSGVAVGDWWVLKPNNVDKNFIYRLIQTQQFDDIANQSTGSKMPRADWNLVSNTEFAIPTSQVEQTKIGGYFSTLDNLITLHQRKCDETKQLKKFMLQKMFPENGEKNPEIRFEGFTDDWEQRKLGEVSKRVIVGLATSVTPYYRAEGVPILRNLNIKENYLDDSDILFLDRSYAESQISKQIRAGDVLTVHTGYIGTSCVVPEKYDKCLTFTTLITTTDNSVLKGEFLAQYLNSDIGMSALQSVTTQGGRQNLNTNDFVKVEIRFPSLLEQSNICAMLRNIDNLITLHQRKCEKLKELKKFMLQNMFV